MSTTTASEFQTLIRRFGDRSNFLITDEGRDDHIALVALRSANTLSEFSHDTDGKCLNADQGSAYRLLRQYPYIQEDDEATEIQAKCDQFLKSNQSLAEGNTLLTHGGYKQPGDKDGIISELEAEKSKLQTENKDLRTENKALQTENNRLFHEFSRVASELQEMQERQEEQDRRERQKRSSCGLL